MKTLQKANIKDIARFLFLYCNKNEIFINHFKLQKLLYYIQAWHLVFFDKFIIFDEQPQAWVNGPVYRSVYNDWKGIYAAQGISISPSHDKETEKLFEEAKGKLELNEQQNKFIDSILNYYGLMPHEKLIFHTHNEAPWNIARGGLGVFDSSEKEITLDSMYEFYSSLRNSREKGARV